MTTQEAFKEMIQDRGIHNDLELSGGYVRKVRKAINDNPDTPEHWGISLDKMHQLLQKVGYSKKQETLWKR